MELTCIAKVVDLPYEAVAKYKAIFEEIARLYRVETGGSAILAPSVAIRNLQRTADAARKLLRHMGVDRHDIGRAANGHQVPTIFDALASVDADQEEAIEEATCRIARLIEILDTAVAVSETERIALEVATDSQAARDATGATGHVGDLSLNNWIGSMMALYKQITGKPPATAHLFTSRKAGGPLIRFMLAAAKPLGIEVTPDSLRARIRKSTHIHSLQK